MECRWYARRHAHETTFDPVAFSVDRLRFWFENRIGSAQVYQRLVRRIPLYILTLGCYGAVCFFTRQLSVRHVESNVGGSSHLGYPRSVRTDR